MESNTSDNLIDTPSNKEIITYNNNQCISINKKCDEMETFDKINKCINNNSIVFNEYFNLKVKKYENGWTKSLNKIEVTEILETSIINNIIPTMFVSQLLDHMNEPKFIINVTATEGQFSSLMHTKKNDSKNHVHTNIHKAAINMLTKSLSHYKNTYVWSIDPGYITNMNGNTYYDMILPLTAQDGANRILHPIISFFNGIKIKTGTLLKNYTIVDF